MLMPTTEWVAPTEFPDLRNAEEIDKELEKKGYVNDEQKNV